MSNLKSRFFALIITMPAVSASLAATASGTGTVFQLRSHLSSMGADADWFSLTGVSSLGACRTLNGLVVFKMNDDAKGQRQFAMVLAAKNAGQPLTAWADDTLTDPNGFCLLRYLDY